jgi:hypothetical protein
MQTWSLLIEFPSIHPACFTVCLVGISQDAAQFTQSPLPSTPPSSYSSSYQGMLSSTLTDAHNGILPGGLPICTSNNPRFLLKHPGVPGSSDGPNGISYPPTEKFTLQVAQGTGHIAFFPSLLCAQNVVTYRYHQNNTDDTIFAVVVVML